jgi:hypothetical protein
VSIAFLILAFPVSLAVCNKAGRLAGLVVMGLFACVAAFFLMPPFLSFRISETADVLAISFYSVFGMAFARKAKRADAIPRAPPQYQSAAVETELCAIVPILLRSEVGTALQSIEFDFQGANLAIPCSAEDSLKILTEVIGAALAVPGVRRVAIRNSQRPGARQLIVAANRVWPPPTGQVVTIGRRERDCEPVCFPGMPPNVEIRWFDNGYDRIYQISIATT